MFFLGFLKWILVSGLLVIGVLSLFTGMGVEVPLVKFKDLEAHGVPAGVAILVAAVALAHFWKITTTETEETSETVSNDEGSTTTVTNKSSKVTTQFKGPLD